MKKILPIILLDAFLAVFLCISGECASPEDTAPRFEYQAITLGKETVECKYLSFGQDLGVDRVTGFDLKEEPGTYPQWVRYFQYQALKNPAGKQEFAPEMYHPGNPERIAFYRKNWEKITTSKAKHADTILSHSNDPGVTMKGTLPGLLFVKIKDTQYVVMRIKYQTPTTTSYSGEYAVFHQGKLVHMDEDIFQPNLALLTKCFANFEKIHTKLKTTQHGLLELSSDPLRHSLADITR